MRRMAAVCVAALLLASFTTLTVGRSKAVAQSGNCLIALSATTASAIQVENPTIDMPTCGMISDGGLSLNAGSIDAAAVGYNASYPLNGGNGYSTVFTGATPQTTSPAADPCSTVTGCANLTNSPPSAGTCYGSQTVTAPATLSPGTYCNMTFSGTGTITFGAGLYYFEGGFNVNGTTTKLAGTGVTFYNAGGGINFGSGTLDLVAPTSGTYANVVFYQPSTDTNSVTFNGSSAATLTGMVYAPKAQMTFDGTTTNLSLVVADTVTLNCNGTMTFAPATSPTVAVAKTDNGPWTIGQSSAHYTITPSDSGTGATSGTITVTDALPTGLTLSATPSGTAWTCVGASGATSLSCTSTTAVAAGGNGNPITVPVTIGASTPIGTNAISNTALIYGGGDSAHSSSGTAASSAADQTTIYGVPSLTLTLTGSISTPVPGNNITYTTTFSNNGTGSSHANVITTPIPSPTCFKVGSAAASLGSTGLTASISYSKDNGATWTYTPVSGACGSASSGYDTNVTDVRWTLTGTLGTTAGSNTGTVSLTVYVP